MAELARAIHETHPTERAEAELGTGRMAIVTLAIEDPGVAADHRFGQAVRLGTVIGFFVMFVVLTASALIAGLGLPGSLAVGTFAGFMASFGWGGMMGVTLIASREMEAAQAAQRFRASGQK